KLDTSHMPRRKFSRLTNAQKQALRGELDAKVPVTELAKKYGVSRRTIYNHKNRWDERLPQSRSKVLTVRVSAEDMERLDALARELDLSRADMARRVLLYAAGVYHIEAPEGGEIEALTKEVSAIGRNVNQAVRAMNAAVLRGQKIPRLQLDQLAHQLYQIARHNDQARSLMVRRAQQQRAHVDQIIEAMKTDGLSE
ncbi:helix-turn-helix domain-containing protein, partial [uncultured Sphingomonas sp.]|uniref:plasmid mobilization protein n=1 Tax=uncultured Sphingomonas sp. TaxID=158754 RepID=UPI0025E49A6B